MNIPKGMDFATAAAIPEAWITAYQLLFKVA
jgi:NADPH:quinone reductase-like Zn-dependent oxidoreductase